MSRTMVCRAFTRYFLVIFCKFFGHQVAKNDQIFLKINRDHLSHMFIICVKYEDPSLETVACRAFTVLLSVTYSKYIMTPGDIKNRSTATKINRVPSPIIVNIYAWYEDPTSKTPVSRAFTRCGLTDGRTDRRTDRQTDRQTDGRTDGHDRFLGCYSQLKMF